MPYIIKMRSTRGYVSKFYKKDDKYNVSYHKHLREAKVWKTEKGVGNAIIKFLDTNKDLDANNFMILKKTNSELGIFEPYDKEPVFIKNEYEIDNIELEKEKKEIKILIKVKKFLISVFKYIKEQIKFYFPE
jgi:hypothetical protein